MKGQNFRPRTKEEFQQWCQLPTAGIPYILLQTLDEEITRLEDNGKDASLASIFRQEILQQAELIPPGAASFAFVQALYIGFRLSGFAYVSEERRLEIEEAAEAAGRRKSAVKGGKESAIPRQIKATLRNEHAKLLAAKFRTSVRSSNALAIKINERWELTSPSAPGVRRLATYIKAMILEGAIRPF